MNYIQKAKEELRKEIDVPDDLLDLYTLLVIIMMRSTTKEDVHDAWSVWQNKTNPTHKSLIPFDELTSEVQELDREYRDAIIKVATKLWKER